MASQQNTSGSTSGVKRTSIHTPLKPASVQDLKAKFDPSKASGAEATIKMSTSSSQSSKITSIGKGASSLASSKSTSSTSSSSGVTLSSLSSSLQSAAQRKLSSDPSASATLTSPRPYSPPSSKSGTGQVKLSNKLTINKPSTTTSTNISTAKVWEPKASDTVGNKSKWETRTSFEKDKDGRLELPVTHITKSGKVEAGNSFNKYGGKKDTKPAFAVKLKESNQVDRPGSPSSGSNDSPPVQRSKRLVAREIKIERLDTGETCYKDVKTSESTKQTGLASSSGGLGKKVCEIKVENVPSDKTSELEFRKVKLRTTKPASAQHNSNISEQKSGNQLKTGTKATGSDTTLDEKRKSRKISPERFERLKYDFERGVPTEYVPRRGSENADHILLQQKARELSRLPSEDDPPIIQKKKKEESILLEGLKVSDFVKQVNKMNPELEGPPKWKVARQRSQASSVASSDTGPAGDSYYQGIPGEDDVGADMVDDEDDIYEKVGITVLSSTDGEQDGDTKGRGRRLAVYSQVKNLKNIALNKLKQKGAKKKEDKKSTSQEPQSDTDEVVIHSDGEGGWANASESSSGTEYEEFEQDEEEENPDGDLYEDLTFSQPNKSTKGNTLTHKLKNIFVNKKVKNKKAKPVVDSGVSAGTDSDGEFEEIDSDLTENLSRTSSERSRGHSDTSSTAPTTDTASVTTSTSTIEEQPNTTATASTAPSPNMASNTPLPPALPPRTAKALTQPPENSPPLPPRNPALSNKATLSVGLDTVVPISPSAGHGKAYDKKKDRFSFGNRSLDGSDPTSGPKLEYLDFNPSSPNTLERIAHSDRKSASLGRPSSVTSSTTSSPSIYMYPDISTFPPEMKQLNNDDNLYVDLEDEHMYGKSSSIYVSRFESEPLYQWYSKDKMIQNTRSDKSASDDLSDEEYLELESPNHSEDQCIYEDVERLLANSSSSSNLTSTAAITNSSQPIQDKNISTRDKPQRRSIIEDVFKNGSTLHRALWCQMPEVVSSGILKTISDKEKKIQEAMFEIMTSEASYLKSLKILINVFLVAPEFSADMSDRCVITRRDRQVLFSNIGHIKDISEGFLKDLEARWQESYYLEDICDIIYNHASKNFEPYVRYCSNQLFQDRTLNSLKQKPEFMEAVKKLEQHPDCQFLPLSSFLLLPMQRITRLPLLVDAICHRLEQDSPRLASCKKAMESLKKVAKRCDEAAKKMQQTEQICLLAANLEFKVKEIALVSSSRFLVKQGEMTLIKSDGTTRKPLSKLLSSGKEHIYLFLFNDILLLTKKKGSTYQVRDYCQRNSLHVEAIDNPDKSRHLAPGMATGVPNIMFLAMLANHENKQVELVLSFKAESERTRWIDAITPTQSDSDTERIYDVWDCPQYQCVRKYLAQQPDELNLEESDVINVTRKMADGWCEGERIRDGEKGWFPASHTEEINNSHVRARNLRLRYRLMIASSQEYTSEDC